MLNAIGKSSHELLERWIAMQVAASSYRPDRISPGELRDNSRAFLAAFERAAASGSTDVNGAAWADVRHVLDTLSASRAARGFSPSETATFVFSLKEALFEQLRAAFAKNPQRLAELTWESSALLDKLGLYATEVHQRRRDAIIVRQQQDMLELSTPVVTLWEGVLALPVIERSTAAARRS